MDNTRLFDGLAEKYQRYRPSYPEELFNSLKTYLEVGRRESWPRIPIVADIGAGTGIATRLLAASLGHHYSYLGIEPCEDMREKARNATDANLAVKYADGLAEALPFENGSAALVFAAQAVHWFDRNAFYAEAQRVLAPGAVLAIIFNNRQWMGNAGMEVYEEFLERNIDGHSRHYRDLDLERELHCLEGFAGFQKYEHSWQREMTVGDFVQMSLSTTRVQRIVESRGEQNVILQLTEILGGDAQRLMTVPYLTELFVIRKFED